MRRFASLFNLHVTSSWCVFELWVTESFPLHFNRSHKWSQRCMHLIRNIKIWNLGRRTALSLWMLPFQLRLPTERTRAHRRRQRHLDVHLRCEPHEASSLSTSTSMAPERIFFTAHWGADEALMRSPNSKIGLFDGEKDVNGLDHRKKKPERHYTVKVFSIRLLNMHFHCIAGEL